MPRAGAAAGLVTQAMRRTQAKLATRRRAPLVDAATGFDAHRAHQRCAARARVVGAAQARQSGVQDVGQAIGHASTFGLQFIAGKVHTKTGAARAALQAGVVVWPAHGLAGGTASSPEAPRRTTVTPQSTLKPTVPIACSYAPAA